MTHAEMCDAAEEQQRDFARIREQFERQRIEAQWRIAMVQIALSECARTLQMTTMLMMAGIAKESE